MARSSDHGPSAHQRSAVLHGSQQIFLQTLRFPEAEKTWGRISITTALFVRYISGNQWPQVTAVQSKSASPPLSGSAPAVPFTSAFPLQPTTPSLHTEEKTLIASSASTFVAFIAAAVTNFLSWRKDRANAVKEKRGPSR